MLPKVIFWFDQPPKVGKGCFNEFSKIWGNDVFYIYMHEFSAIRAISKWADDDYGKATVIKICDNPILKTEEIFVKYPDAIHIISGFKSLIFKYLKKYLLSDKYKFINFSERPGIYGPIWKRLLKYFYIPISEHIIAYKYQKHIKAYLPLGVTGVKTAIRYGWSNDKLYPFMYDPVDLVTDHEVYPVHKPLRFLYVGRFSKFTKGTDILIRAFDLMKSKNTDYSLDLVGGYGDLKDKVIAWANKKNNVSFLGAWDSLKVGMNMKNYDICVVPSKFDGWNLLVNEAIRAYIAVIATNQAVSDECVTVGKTGLVVKGGSASELAAALDYAVSNPDIVGIWKNNSKYYSKYISSLSVATYLRDIIIYTCIDNSKSKPICPWL